MGAILGGKGPDPSQAMAAVQMHNSDNAYNLGMARIGNERMQAMQSYLLGSQQINAMTDIADDKNHTALRIAQMNYQAQTHENDNETKVAMRELDVREHEAVLAAKEGNRVDTTDFLS